MAEEIADGQVSGTHVIRFYLTQNTIIGIALFDTGNLIMITGGRNEVRTGVIVHRERHTGVTLIAILEERDVRRKRAAE